MTASITRLPLVLDAPRAELAKLCRKLLLDAETNASPELLSETHFLKLLNDIQAAHGSDTLNEDDLWEIVRDEERRVTDAMCVASILLPKISTLLKQRPALVASSPAIPSSEIPASPSAQKPAAARPAQLGIADLLEGMLDQERNEARKSSSTPRY